MTTFVESTITFPYKRSLGPVIGAYMTALTDRRILGIRYGEQVMSPPMEWDPATGDSLGEDLVEVGPAGTVESWTWVASPSVQHPLDHPFGFAFIKLDGATNLMLHAVDCGSPDALERVAGSEGVRVAPRWRGTRRGAIDDIVCFVLGEKAETDGEDGGKSEVPVERMDYNASITYKNPVPSAIEDSVAASAEGRLLAHTCPTCGRVYAGGRGHCPLDATVFTSADQFDLATTGTVTNFVVVTPTQYPGQTETEPFARVFVLPDDPAGDPADRKGADMLVLGYQPVVDLPAADVRVGMRVEAVWAGKEDEVETLNYGGGSFGSLVGWRPLDEPDLIDPELVNRIF